MSPKESHLS